LNLYTKCFILNDMVDYLANRFYWKIFRKKVTWLEEGYMMEMWTWPWVTLSKSGQGHSCFLKLKLIFFIPYFCSLSRELPNQYNKVTFHWVLSKLRSLKVTISPTLFACACEQDSYTCVIHSYPHCLTYTHVHGNESNSSQLNN